MNFSDLWQLPRRPASACSATSRSIPLALLLFVVLWDLLVRWQDYPTFILPSPGTVWTRFGALLANGMLMHTGVTVAEVLGGLALGLSGRP